MPSNESPKSSVLNLEDLMKLSKNSPQEMMTSQSVQTLKVSSPNNENLAVSLQVPKKITNALEQFEDAVGGRQTLIDNLSLANLDKREAHFLDLLLDPRRQEDNINIIAKDAGLKPIQIIDLFRSASFARAHAISMGKLSSALPDVISDIAAKSVDARIECPQCQGDGKISDGESCMTCNGKGTVMRYSDLDRQKIVLEAGGLTKKGGGVNVNVQQNNIGTVQASSYFSKFVKDSDSTAYDVGEIIDADIKDSK